MSPNYHFFNLFLKFIFNQKKEKNSWPGPGLVWPAQPDLAQARSGWPALAGQALGLDLAESSSCCSLPEAESRAQCSFFSLY